MTAGIVEARCLWFVEPGRVELRSARLPAVGDRDVLVRTTVNKALRGGDR